MAALYLIEILHQTTTCGKCEDCLRRLYLIEILHQTTTSPWTWARLLCCILSKFYIKPQLIIFSRILSLSCILSKFYIKPQLILMLFPPRAVVSYRNSTSNHNSVPIAWSVLKLYLIEILHQTTTPWRARRILTGCILSKFYIKPQLSTRIICTIPVVSYRNSTSNHNGRTWSLATNIVVSYRNSTSNHNRTYRRSKEVRVVSYRNSTSNHNRTYRRSKEVRVVSYRNSTSNHNSGSSENLLDVLYLIEILHQTTTFFASKIEHVELYLIEILHQTTTKNSSQNRPFLLYLIEILHQTTTGCCQYRLG